MLEELSGDLGSTVNERHASDERERRRVFGHVSQHAAGAFCGFTMTTLGKGAKCPRRFVCDVHLWSGQNRATLKSNGGPWPAIVPDPGTPQLDVHPRVPRAPDRIVDVGIGIRTCGVAGHTAQDGRRVFVEGVV